MPPARLIGYIRVSKVGGRSGDSFQSPGEQRRAIEHIVALTPGAGVSEWVEELDQSGGTMNRAGARRAIAAVDNGEADGIVMAYLDRWARTPAALEKIEEWSKQGKVFLSAAERIDTTTPHGLFACGVLLLVAKLQRDRHIETWANSTRNAVQRGVAIRVPYGYQRGPDGRLLIDERAASAVRRAFALRSAGVGVAQIARELDADGIAPAHATAWTRQTVRALLRVRTYLGEATYGEHVTTDAHPAIIDRATWDAAQTPRRQIAMRGDGQLLNGLVRCGGCGYIMGASTSNGHRRYNCNRNHGGGRCASPTSCLAERLERFVTSAFLDRYGDVRVGSAQGSPELTALERAIERAQVEFVQWRDDTDMRTIIGTEDYRAGLVVRKVKLDAARDAHALAVRESSASSLVVDAAMWDELTIAERRTLLSAGIDDVVLRRASSTHAPLGGRCVIRWVGEAADHGVRRGQAGVLSPIESDPVRAGMAGGHDAAEGIGDG
jgi:DNA invertase Pin-like site-specific DNA recombinase